MKSETTFKNFWFPTLKPTNPPKPVDPKQAKTNNLVAYIDEKISIKKNQPICHIGTNAYFSNDQFEVYELPTSISILTYNIWFEQHNKSTRFQCIIKMLASSNADFICLQQVTQQFMQLIFLQSKELWVKNYYVSIFPMGWYDTLIITKYKCRFYKIPFQNTGQGRSMLFAELVQAQGQNIIVGSMHYESLGGNEKIRSEQLMSVQKICQSCQRVIIVGDYNFSDYAAENKAIDKAYTDIWVKIHKKGENGPTMAKTPQFSSWRPDHILCKVPSTIDLTSSEIHKIGQFSIPPYEKEDFNQVAVDAVIRTPSDHYGLFSWLPMI